MAEPLASEHGKSPVNLVRTTPPFVGRRAQLERFEHCLQDAMAGQPQVVLMAGEVGIGKTRLLREVQAVALRRGVQVCFGRCHEGLSFPYFPFAESLLAHLGQLSEESARALGADVAVIRQFLRREWSATSAADSPLSGQSDQEKLRLLVTVARATIGLAQRAPMLLVMDDLHWADPPSLELFGHLVFTVADTAMREPVPLLIVGTYRPEEEQGRLAHLLARLHREELCQPLDLAGLDEAEMRELVQGLGLERPSHQLVATIAAATQGNPLFVQEVVHHLRQQGALQQRGGSMVTTVAPTDLQLPRHVVGALVARTRNLSTDCQRLLTLAACLGGHFSLRVLSAVSGTGEEAVLDVLDEGLRQRLLVSEAQTFQFAHPLIWHVFYNAPSAVRRQRLHAQIARALERLYAPNIAAHVLEIAHHLVRAGPAAEASEVLEYTRQAGDQAFRMFAWGEAARYYEAALAVAEATGCLALQDRAALHYRTGLAYYRDMDAGPCLDHYEKAIAAYRGSGDLRGLAQALIEKMRLHYTLAAVPFGTLLDTQPLEEILTALGEREPALRGSILSTMAQIYWMARQADKGQVMAQRALELGQRFTDDRLCAHACHALALTQLQSRPVAEALELWQRALAYARRTGDLWLQGIPLLRLPYVLFQLGQLEEAQEAAADASSLARKTLNWGDYSLVLSYQASVAVVRGDFAAAEQHARGTMQLVYRSGYPWSGLRALLVLACTHALRGAWAEADAALAMLVEPGRVFPKPGAVMQVFVRVFRQLLRAYADTPLEEALEPLAADMMQAVGADTYSLGPLCALVELGDLVAAPAVAMLPYETLSQAAARGVLFPSGWSFLLPRVLGVAALCNRRWSQADAHLQAAIAAATRAGARQELGRAYLDYARLLAARGSISDRRRALESARQARAIFDALGMPPYAQRVVQLTETLHGLSPRRQQHSNLPADRPSEHEVGMLLRIAQGRTHFLG
jgi:tetratricopeptide (TPR) repeat protein